MLQVYSQFETGLITFRAFLERMVPEQARFAGLYIVRPQNPRGFPEIFEDGFEIFDDILREAVGIVLKLGLVEAHGLTPVAPLHPLRRATPPKRILLR